MTLCRIANYQSIKFYFSLSSFFASVFNYWASLLRSVQPLTYGLLKISFSVIPSLFFCRSRNIDLHLLFIQLFIFFYSKDQLLVYLSLYRVLLSFQLKVYIFELKLPSYFLITHMGNNKVRLLTF